MDTQNRVKTSRDDSYKNVQSTPSQISTRLRSKHNETKHDSTFIHPHRESLEDPNVTVDRIRTMKCGKRKKALMVKIEMQKQKLVRDLQRLESEMKARRNTLRRSHHQQLHDIQVQTDKVLSPRRPQVHKKNAKPSIKHNKTSKYDYRYPYHTTQTKPEIINDRTGSKRYTTGDMRHDSLPDRFSAYSKVYDAYLGHMNPIYSDYNDEDYSEDIKTMNPPVRSIPAMKSTPTTLRPAQHKVTFSDHDDSIDITHQVMQDSLEELNYQETQVVKEVRDKNTIDIVCARSIHNQGIEDNDDTWNKKHFVLNTIDEETVSVHVDKEQVMESCDALDAHTEKEQERWTYQYNESDTLIDLSMSEFTDHFNYQQSDKESVNDDIKEDMIDENGQIHILQPAEEALQDPRVMYIDNESTQAVEENEETTELEPFKEAHNDEQNDNQNKAETINITYNKCKCTVL
eukprot:471121_1